MKPSIAVAEPQHDFSGLSLEDDLLLTLAIVDMSKGIGQSGW